MNSYYPLKIVTLQRPVETGQYTSDQYARLATTHGIRLSVGRRGQCWDNAVAESFFATIKTELLHRQPCPPTRQHGKRYSSTSKAGTTPAADTPPSATSAPPTTKPLHHAPYRQPGQPE